MSTQGVPPTDWDRGCLDRLVENDRSAWTRLLAEVASVVARARASWGLSTMLADRLHDQLLDAVLANDMRVARRIRLPGCFPAYLVRIANRKARRLAECERRGRVHVASDLVERGAQQFLDRFSTRAPPASGSATLRIASSLLRTRGTVTPRQFRFLWLCHVERISQRKVARALGITQPAVSQALARAIAALRA